LRDFMTYNEVEVLPGPNLNLILGPNGTGKSTIVSAICLGMSGKASTLARASQLGGYVRHGADKATVEIELNNPCGENYLITREITKDNKSTWKLQGKSVPHSKVEEIIQRLHIQVDNLCQFLPQEQVQNFSRLKDKELLVGTMKAVGNPDLENYFEQLIKLQAGLGAISTNAEQEKVELSKLKEENKRWESEVQSFKERENLKLSVKLLEKKKVWLRYKDELNLYKRIQQNATNLKQQYDTIAARFKPLEDKIAAKEKLILKTQELLKLSREKITGEYAKVNSKLSSADQQKLKMENLASELSSKRQAEAKRMDEINNFKQQVLSLENELEELSQQEGEMLKQLREVGHQLEELARTESGIRQKKEAATEEVRNLRNERDACISKIKNMEDVDRNRLEMLRRDRPQVHEAVVWLRENKARFRGPIYEPLVLSLNIKDAKMGKYVENRVNYNDRIAFFCEDKADMNELLQVLREEKGLAINVAHSPPSHEPLSVEYQPRMAISDLREYGFHSYVRELFNAPDPVVRYLCKMYNIHNIPVGDRRVYDNFGVIRDRFGNIFNMFYGDTKVITIKSSRYRSDKLTQTSDVGSSKFFGLSVNVQALELLKSSVAELEERFSAGKRALEAILQEENVTNRSREALLQRRNALQKWQGNRRVVTSRLTSKRSQLANLQKETLDLSAEEQRVKAACAVCVKAMIDHMAEHGKLLEQLLVRDKEREALQIHMDVLRACITSARSRLNEEKDQITQLKAEKDEAERLCQEAKGRVTQVLDEARRMTGVRQFDDLSDEMKAKLAALPTNLTDVDDAIHNASARIQLMGRADEQVVRDYEARKARIEELSEAINKISDRASLIRQKIDEVRGKLMPPLLDLISRINTSFGRFYASMHCAGEVCLYTGEEDQEDFKNFGIRIRVKYRSSEPLIDLSANHHSGGERAVATALYMLAMQELTQVPFRCVDEINQGMDPFNERRVFDLLVQTACHESSAQYFLLTPKLLPNLNYSNNMKIHFVQNGEDVMPYKMWNVEKHLSIIRALNRD